MFYNSGSLGGVAYHNTSGENENWTGSWTAYWWRICGNDGAWTNTTYSFTTAYQWGDLQTTVMDEDDIQNTYGSLMYKNASGEYYLFYGYDDFKCKKSTTGTNFSLLSEYATIKAGGIDERPYHAFTYGGDIYVSFNDYASEYTYKSSDSGVTWAQVETHVTYTAECSGVCSYSTGMGDDMIYYDGNWQWIRGMAWVSGQSSFTALEWYYGTIDPWSFTDSGTDLYVTGAHVGTFTAYYFPSAEILNGILHVVYCDVPNTFGWYTYDGVSWTNKGTIEANIAGGVCSMVRDYTNNQLVAIYVDGSDDLVYRVTDNTTSWSDSHLIYSGVTTDYGGVRADFIDDRIVINLKHNRRGIYNQYIISSPDYSKTISGLNATYNRIQWPDASPGDTNVNCSVFSLKNIDNRSIKTITWHFEDLGEITKASNFEVWTNMSGAWASIGVCDASGNVTTLDISGEMAGGLEWIVGQTTWWKIEILAVGAVNEDIHTTDEDIYYKITF